eukprot:6171109-Amphidinium_carterae.7
MLVKSGLSGHMQAQLCEMLVNRANICKLSCRPSTLLRQLMKALRHMYLPRLLDSNPVVAFARSMYDVSWNLPASGVRPQMPHLSSQGKEQQEQSHI